MDSTVPVELLREGKTVSVQARIAERPPGQPKLSQVPHLPPGHPPIGPRGGRGGVLGGVEVREPSPQDLRALDLPPNTRGVAVANVEAGSDAADKLRPGDVIESINLTPVGSLADYARTLRALPAGEPVVLAITRNGRRTMVVLTPG